MITCSGDIVAEPQPRYNPPVFNSFFKGAAMLRYPQDPDPIPAAPLGPSQRQLAEEAARKAAEAAKSQHQRAFERGAHPYPSKPAP